jgi:hypothetical protein
LQKTRPFAENKTRAAWMSDAQDFASGGVCDHHLGRKCELKPTRTIVIVSVRYVLSTISVNLTGPRLGHRTELQKLIRLDPKDRQFSAAAYVDEVASHEDQVSD